MPFPVRPRVSRETRLLLATVFFSLAALWVLAKIRFPEQPRTPNPVAPLLTQLAPGIAFENLERVVFDLEPQVVSALHLIVVPRPPVAGSHDERQWIPSLRFRHDEVLALIKTPTAGTISGATLVAQDPATKLAVLETSTADLSPIRTWTPQQFDYPRYFLVSDVSQGRISLRPIFVGHLTAARDAVWS